MLMMKMMLRRQVGKTVKVTGGVFDPAGRERVQRTAACPAASGPDWAAGPERTGAWWSAAWAARWRIDRS